MLNRYFVFQTCVVLLLVFSAAGKAEESAATQGALSASFEPQNAGSVAGDVIVDANTKGASRSLTQSEADACHLPSRQAAKPDPQTKPYVMKLLPEEIDSYQNAFLSARKSFLQETSMSEADFDDLLHRFAKQESRIAGYSGSLAPGASSAPELEIIHVSDSDRRTLSSFYKGFFDRICPESCFREYQLAAKEVMDTFRQSIQESTRLTPEEKPKLLAALETNHFPDYRKLLEDFSPNSIAILAADGYLPVDQNSKPIIAVTGVKAAGTELDQRIKLGSDFLLKIGTTDGYVARDIIAHEVAHSIHPCHNSMSLSTPKFMDLPTVSKLANCILDAKNPHEADGPAMHLWSGRPQDIQAWCHRSKDRNSERACLDFYKTDREIAALGVCSPSYGNTIDEAYADVVGAEVAGKLMLKDHVDADRAHAAISSLSATFMAMEYCTDPTQLDRRFGGADLHPCSAVRVDLLPFLSPSFQAATGCTTPRTQIKACPGLF